jgi:DNA-directed RNA polymerase specialized sigma24 family protein
MDNAATVSVGQGMAKTTSSDIFKLPVPGLLATYQTSEVFGDWFSRCYEPLHFTACRILGSPEGASLAVENCWLTASRNPPSFDCEGEFRSWLFRILIDEASAILQSRLRNQLDPEQAHLWPLHSSVPPGQSDPQGDTF